SVPSSQLNMYGQTTASFTATALVAPLPVEISFKISGTNAKTFQPQELLPKFLVQFAPLRTITVNVPPVMYVNLDSDVTVTLQKSPETGTVVVDTIIDAIFGIGGFSNTWSTSTDPVQVYFTCTPQSSGAGTIQFSPTLTGTVAYETNTRPASSITVTVKDPSWIGLSSTPVNVFWGSLNAINLATTILINPSSAPDSLTVDDNVTVQLRTNDSSCIVMNPANGILSMPATAGVFSIYATRPCVAFFNVTFTTKVNRFIINPSFNNVTINFRQLKPIQVIPPLTQYIVGQPVPYTIVLDETPEPGHALNAQLLYSGSPGNINLPAAATFSDANLVRNLVTS
ncbi:MAG: hypothetical protein Q8M03_00095, partial [Legionella sp.]|nr:hypothetical protein [Legionella sp.]